jgi:hypothetical protein
MQGARKRTGGATASSKGTAAMEGIVRRSLVQPRLAMQRFHTVSASTESLGSTLEAMVDNLTDVGRWVGCNVEAVNIL